MPDKSDRDLLIGVVKVVERIDERTERMETRLDNHGGRLRKLEMHGGFVNGIEKGRSLSIKRIAIWMAVLTGIISGVGALVALIIAITPT